MNIFDQYLYSKNNKRFIDFIKKNKVNNKSFIEVIQKWKTKNSFYVSDFYFLTLNFSIPKNQIAEIENLIDETMDEDVIDINNNWIGTEFEKNIGLTKKIEQEEELLYLKQFHKSKGIIINLLKQNKNYKDLIKNTKITKLRFGQNFLKDSENKTSKRDFKILSEEVEKMDFCIARITEKYLPMVQKLAWDFYRWKKSSGIINNFEREDGTSAGLEGLLTAIEQWDEKRSKTVSTSAYLWISTKIKNEFEKNNSDLHINPSDLTLLSKAIKTKQQQEEELNIDYEQDLITIKSKDGQTTKFNYFNTFKTIVDDKTMKIANDSASYINDNIYIPCQQNLLNIQQSSSKAKDIPLKKKLILGIYPYIIHTKKEVSYIIKNPLQGKDNSKSKKNKNKK